MRLEAVYDSHVHWAATGEFSGRLRLEGLNSPQDISILNIERHHKRGDWLLGFGWDQNKWSEAPSRAHLDQAFPGTPVAFSRVDGHVLWVNTEALKRAGLWVQNAASPTGGVIELGSDGWPTGILKDKARAAIERLIPKQTAFEVRRDLLKATQKFNREGFTHIRDMTCDEVQWNEAVHLDQSGLLTLAVEEYFWLKSASDLDSVLDLAVKARGEATANLRVKGLKIFYDGALGSEGALLSKCYCGSGSHGLRLWEPSGVREVLRKTWEKGLEVAIHAIGDAASAEIIDLASDIKTSGHVGTLHLEHAEILLPETVDKMKNLKVECHLQPAHWLGDREWLSAKIGELAPFAFPWRRLQEADVYFDFGSDSPIDPPSFKRTLQALRESADAGIPRLLGLPNSHMAHRDLSWAPNSYTIFENETPLQVVFRGEDII